MSKAPGRSDAVVLAIVRVSVGVVFVAAGITKILGLYGRWIGATLVGSVLRYPSAIAVLGAVEVGCGVAFALGGGGRRLALALMVILLLFTGVLLLGALYFPETSGCGCLGRLNIEQRIPYLGLIRNGLLLAILWLNYRPRLAGPSIRAAVD